MGKFRKKYITVEYETDVPVDEILEKVDDELLVEEIKSRNLQDHFIIYKDIEIAMNVTTPIDFKRYLCNLLNQGYHISNEKLIELIKEKI